MDHGDGAGDRRDRGAVTREDQVLAGFEGVDERHDVVGQARHVDALGGAGVARLRTCGAVRLTGGALLLAGGLLRLTGRAPR